MKKRLKLALIVLLLIAVAAVSFGIQKMHKERAARQPGGAVTEQAEDAEGLMRSAAKHPYLNLKIAACYVLNDYWKLRLWFPLVWRWWAYVWRLNEAQVASLLAEAQKKTADFLKWYSMSMELGTAIRADLKTTATQSLSHPIQKSGGGQLS